MQTKKPPKPVSPLAMFLDRYQVMTMIGVSYPTLWAWMCAGKFPRPRSPGGTCNKNEGKNFWLRSEIETWAAALPAREYRDPPPKHPRRTNTTVA